MTGTDFMDAGIALLAALLIIVGALVGVLLFAFAYTRVMEIAEERFRANTRREAEDDQVADLDAIWDIEWTEGTR